MHQKKPICQQIKSKKNAINNLTNLENKDTLEETDVPTNKEKIRLMNCMSKSKKKKIVHFLACNCLLVKQLYPKMVKFLSDEMNVNILNQLNNILKRV